MIIFVIYYNFVILFNYKIIIIYNALCNIIILHNSKKKGVQRERMPLWNFGA